MYSPLRPDSRMFISDWAKEWLIRDGGWENKVYDIAAFDPIRFEEICNACTLYEIAKAWKTKMALSEYAWNDPDD